MSTCYLNGEFVPLAAARVSVLDRGFIFGDGVYEVIPVFGGRPFRLAEHFARLAQSLGAIGINNPLNPAEWVALVRDLVARNAIADASVYLQITRGVAPRNHAAPADCRPTVFAMVQPTLHASVPDTADAILVEDQRWGRCDIKATSLLANVLARTAATAAGAHEAILIRDGYLTEGAASNVFIVSGGVIKTPPHSHHILPGITRDAVVEALAGSSDAVHEVAVTRSELLTADEVWVTSSTRDLLPVVRIDGQAVGPGGVGPVFRRVLAVYVAFKATELARTASLLRGS
jgi:D-alanine transaminase